MPSPLCSAMRVIGATQETPAATTAPSTGPVGSSIPSRFRLSRATQAPERAWGISRAGRNRGGKTPILSRNISPSAANAHDPVLGLRRDAARNAGPSAILNPLSAASASARSKGVFRSGILDLLVASLRLKRIVTLLSRFHCNIRARTCDRTERDKPDGGTKVVFKLTE